MTFEQAIRAKFGKTLPQIPSDCVMRTFRIDGKPDGFAVRTELAGAFGNMVTGEAYIWDGGVRPFQMTGQEKKKAMNARELAFERLIIQCAFGLMDRGDVLSDADMLRLGLAMQRTENANV